MKYKQRTNTRSNLPLYNKPRRVAFWDMEYSIANHGYVHEPDGAFCSFGDERNSCSVLYQSFVDQRHGQATECASRCALCTYVARNNDYMRGFVQYNGKREIAPPNYPLPSIHVGAYVLFADISQDTGKLVIWCADHEVIAV